MVECMKLNASAPLHVLVDALARVEWGPLAGRQFAFARALLQFLATTSRGTQYTKTGAVVITRAQIAQRCGYSTKTVQRNMPVFEEDGLLAWQRGAALFGTPTPGTLKVNKRLLVQYIKDARAPFGTREARRHARTRARLERFHRVRMAARRPKMEKRGDMKTPFIPLQGNRTPRLSKPRGVSKNPLKKVFTPAQLKKVEEMNATLAEVFQYLPATCTHRSGVTTRCNYCRSIAVNAMYSERKARKVQALNAAQPNLENDKPASPNAWWQYMAIHYPNLTPARWILLSKRKEDMTAFTLWKEQAS